MSTPSSTSRVWPGRRPGETPEQPIDLTSPVQRGPKRKATSLPGSPSRARTTARQSQNVMMSSPYARAAPQKTPLSKKRKKTESPGEKRLRAFRDHAPLSFGEVHARALSQRFFVLSRKRIENEGGMEEHVELTGSTGNIYTVTIARRPNCTCPHALKGNQCKHVLYVMDRVLRAPFHLVYQLALLSTELQQIFNAAPPVNPASGKDEKSDSRKPVEGDCPICFCELDAKSPESIVWCRAACGQNMHQNCFNQWAKAKSGHVTCPFCRSKWGTDGNGDVGAVVERSQGVSHEGYVNVANQLGISSHRPTTYWSNYESGRRRYRPWHERLADYERYNMGDEEEDDDEDEDY